MLPVDPILVALAFLVAGVVASFVPLVPGGALSTLGVGYYWLLTDELATVVFAAFALLGAVTVVVDLLGGAVSARVGGASTTTAAVAAVAAVALLFVLGPLGAILGVAGTVFVAEYRRHGDVRRGIRTAGVTTVGMLASTAMQVVLTGSMLVGFLFAVYL
ncbi:MAG: DUF456 domain-containing protein [Natronomonas sp.]